MHRLLRAGAVVIAIAGAIDPAVTSTRRTRPEISVLAADTSADRALSDRVADELSGRFNVIRAPFAGAAGTVIVGSQVPANLTGLATPVFGVTPGSDRPFVALEAVGSPARAALHARVAIAARARISGARGRKLDVTLRMGELAIDRVLRDVLTDDESLDVPLSFIPTAVGAIPLHVTAEVAGARQATADLLVDVREQRLAVLFYDPRASWMSTFVRRSLERDPRVVITSRVITSRNLSSDAGRPPAFDDAAALDLFDAVVVGAPDALSDTDVAGLEGFMRRRGGSVVLLFDRKAGGAHQRLTGVVEWAGGTGAVNVVPLAAESGSLRATEVIWPAELPAGALPIARDSANHPIVWRSTVGAGRLTVSGVLDAWRFRDPAVSAFERFWQTTVAAAAAEAPPPIGIHVVHALLAPGELANVSVTLRAAALASSSSSRTAHADIGAVLESEDRRTDVTLWPDAVGRLHGSFRAPASPGSYRIVVSTADGARADAPVMVANGVTRPAPNQRDLLNLLSRSSGGIALSADRLEELPAAIGDVLKATPRRETWHPMRSAWWIVPFTLLLGLEWWWRRRKGLA